MGANNNGQPTATGRFITDLTYGFNLISLISASIVVLTVILIGIYDRKLINRVSFRLQAAIAFSDIIRHTLQYITAAPSSVLCPIIGFLNISFDILYAVLNIMITLNMQLMLLHNYYPKPQWERNYWWCSLIVVCVFNLPFVGIFGANARGLCFVKATYAIPGLITMEATLYFLTLAVSMVYCITIPILVLLKLYFKRNAFNKLKRHVKLKDRIQGSLFERSFTMLIMRNLMYPVACFLSLMGGVTHVLCARIFGLTAPWPMYFSLICLRLTGFLNLIAFSFDPTLHRALHRIRADLAKNRSNQDHHAATTTTQTEDKFETVLTYTGDGSWTGTPPPEHEQAAVRLAEKKSLLMKYL